MKSGLFTIAFTVIFFSACQTKSVSIDSDLVSMYVDLLVAYENSNKDLTKFYQAKNGILANYNITYQTMKSRINEIETHPDQWPSFQEAVVNKIESIKSNYQGE